MGKLHALPLQDSIVIGQGTIMVNGHNLETDQVQVFAESAVAFRDNWARKVIHEQVRYLAVNGGVFKSVSLDEIMFFKAALWCLNEEDKLLDRLTTN